MSLSALTQQIQAGELLDASAIERAADRLLDESQSVEERADFLAALHKRGETPEEVAHFARNFLEKAVRFPISGDGLMDVCGTGNDRAGFFNISTAVFFVAAGAGIRVAKHGNRGITSRSGGADVLEALDIRIDLPVEEAAAALEEVGCCFLFAPHYHPSFKAVVPVRKHLASQGSASVFNLLGPLLNPVRPEFQLAGVYNPDALALYIEAMKSLGRRRAWAVHGQGPQGLRLDEVSTLGDTLVHEVFDSKERFFALHPNEFGINPGSVEELAGGTATENAAMILSVLDGSDRSSRRDIVLANTAAALVVADQAATLAVGLDLAKSAVDSGKALAKLNHLREFSALKA